MNGIVMVDSVIHRLDPRTKLVGCFVVILATALPSHQIPVLLLEAGFIIAVIYLSQVGVARVLRGLRSLRLLFLLTFMCQVLLTRGDPLLSWGWISVSEQGVYLGISTFLRLVILYLVSSLLIMTTSPFELSAGLELLLSPLTYLRFPVHQFVMIIDISLRFIPMIIEDAGMITRAQKSRGAQFDSGPIAVRLRNIMAVLIPLLASSMRRASALALALESRGYTCSRRYDSSTAGLYFTWKDGVAVGVVAAVFLLPVLYGWLNLF